MGPIRLKGYLLHHMFVYVFGYISCKYIQVSARIYTILPLLLFRARMSYFFPYSFFYSKVFDFAVKGNSTNL